MRAASTIAVLRHEIGRMPPALGAGLALFGAAGAADLLYHLLEAAHLEAWTAALEGLLGHEAHSAHLLLFAGMCLVWLGIVTGKRSADDAQARGFISRP